MNEKQSVRSYLRKHEENKVDDGLSVLSFKQLAAKFERMEPKVHTLMSVRKVENKRFPANKLKLAQASKSSSNRPVQTKFVLNKPSTLNTAKPLSSRTLPARTTIKPPVKPNELRNNKITIKKKVSTLKKTATAQKLCDSINDLNQVEEKFITNEVLVEAPIEEVFEHLNPTNSVVELNEQTEVSKLIEVLPVKKDESNLHLNVDAQLESRLKDMEIIRRQPSQQKIHKKHRKPHHRNKNDDKNKNKDENINKNSLYSIEKSRRNKKATKSKNKKSFFTICRLKLKQFFKLKKK